MLVPSAISVVDLLTIPLAVKRFQESNFHSKVLALSQKLVYAHGSEKYFIWA